MSSIKDVQFIEIPKIADLSGNLSVVEKETIPFEIQRVYYLYDVRSDQNRSGFAHKTLHQVLIALSGSFDVILRDGNEEKEVTLNKPNQGLLIVAGIWSEIQNFSSGAVCLVIASDVFNEDDYIRDYSEYTLTKHGISQTHVGH